MLRALFLGYGSCGSMTLVQDNKSVTIFMPFPNQSRLRGSCNSGLYHNGVSRIASLYNYVLLDQRYVRLSNQNLLVVISVMRSRKSGPKTKRLSNSNS